MKKVGAITLEQQVDQKMEGIQAAQTATQKNADKVPVKLNSKTYVFVKKDLQA